MKIRIVSKSKHKIGLYNRPFCRSQHDKEEWVVVDELLKTERGT